MKIKRGDSVLVVTGEDKSKTPRLVEQVLAGGEKVVIEGVNLVYKHVRRGHPKSPQGGRLRMEKPISSSNIMFYCPTCQKGVKLGLRLAADGSKERHCRKCGKGAGKVSPARKAKAGEAKSK